MSGNVRLSKTVLLVDDLDILRKMIRDFLKSLGIEVLEVSNATERTLPYRNNRPVAH